MMNLFLALFRHVYSLRNRIDFALRQAIRWSRPGLHLVNEDKTSLLRHLPPASRSQALQEASVLRRAYRLEALYHLSTVDNYLENLFYVQLMETALNRVNVVLPDPLHVVDIGPSSWFYIRGLYQFLKLWNTSKPRRLDVIGYETDPYRVYSNFYSRYDHAQAYCSGLEGVKYIPSAFKPIVGKWDVALLFFPFVFLPDHLRWGLPQNTHQPLKLLEQAWASVKPGGVLLVVNQGEKEAAEQQKLFNAANIAIRAAFPFDSILYQYPLRRFVHVAVRSG